jgi:hypothetical protein
VLGKPDPIDVVLLFEGVPVWMMVMEPSRIRTLYVVEHVDRQALTTWLEQQNLPGNVVDRLLSRFQNGKVRFCVDSPSVNGLTLVSGSLHYTDSVVSVISHTPNTKVLGVLDHHFHGRLRNGRPSGIPVTNRVKWNTWTRVRHETVRGSTRFVSCCQKSVRYVLVFNTFWTSVFVQNVSPA